MSKHAGEYNPARDDRERDALRVGRHAADDESWPYDVTEAAEQPTPAPENADPTQAIVDGLVAILNAHREERVALINQIDADRDRLAGAWDDGFWASEDGATVTANPYRTTTKENA